MAKPPENENVTALWQSAEKLKKSIDKAIRNYTENTAHTISQLYSDAQSLRTVASQSYPRKVIEALAFTGEKGCYAHLRIVCLNLENLNRKWDLYKAGTKDTHKHFDGSPEENLQINSLDYLRDAIKEIRCFQGCLKMKVPEYFPPVNSK